MATVYKGWTLPTVGGSDGTWGTTINDTTLVNVDKNLGGITSKTLTSSNVSLSSSESAAAILRFTGTLGANVQVTTSCQGFHMVENLCTLGAFAVTITNGVSGVTVPYGRHVIIFDSTNGARILPSDSLPSGTVMLFVQTSAPTGWTKSTTHNNKALRIVSGTASSGGSTAFTTVFTSRTLAANNLPNINISITDPGHYHIYNNPVFQSAPSGGGYTRCYTTSSGNTETKTTGITAAIDNNARGGVTQQGIDFAVQYVDCIIATKD